MQCDWLCNSAFASD